MTQATDAELWRSASSGEAAAFGTLFERHANAVYNPCFRRTADWSLAEDLMSVVFLEAWRRRSDVVLAGESARPWLLVVATNVIRHRRRAQRRHRAALERLPRETEPDFVGEAEARLDDERQMRAALALLSRLPRREQDVFALCAWADLTYEETAAALGIPVGTVRSRLSRARARVRRLLEERDGARTVQSPPGRYEMSSHPVVPPQRPLSRERMERRMRHLVSEIAGARAAPAAPRSRHPWLVTAAGAATAATAAAVFLGTDSGGDGTASAATVLRQAAVATRAQPAPPRPGPGEYLYVKSESANLSVFPEDMFAVLVPRVREMWVEPEGGRMRETSGEPKFLSERDRERWIAAGRPDLSEPVWGGAVEAPPALDLPSDPDALYARLEAQSEGHPEGVHEEMSPCSATLCATRCSAT